MNTEFVYCSIIESSHKKICDIIRARRVDKEYETKRSSPLF